MRAYQRRWRAENREHYRELQRESDKRRRAARTQMMRKWRNKADPQHLREIARAHAAVARALKDGRLKRKPCEVCGAETVEAHHADYSKPLDVRWLCKPHHYAADNSKLL
jgi:ribosomal protein S27AE